MDDSEAYLKYPHHRKWFNKLYLAEVMKYKCGPSGIPPQEDGTYIIRPIYNILGMGLGARLEFIKAGDNTKVEPGYFWCEYISGKHYSATYEFIHDSKGTWVPLHCWEGVNFPINLSKFMEWKRSSFIPEVPRHFNVLSDVRIINIEFKGNSPIEVHLRESPDPQYDHMIPTWKNDSSHIQNHYELSGYTWIESYDDAEGYLENPRTGFWVK